MTHISKAHRMPTTAVVDLKSAYDTEPQKLLQSVLETTVKENTPNIVGLWLQPVEIRKPRNSSATKEKIARGEPEDSLLSPKLFNRYIDTHADFLTAQVSPGGDWTNKNKNWDITLLVDDVKLQVVREESFQKLLTHQVLRRENTRWYGASGSAVH